MFDLRPLRAATFRHLAAGYWVNELGNWFGEIALAILVFDRTGSALATAGLFLSLRFLPAPLAPFLTVRLEVARPHLTLAAMYALEGAFFGLMALLTRRFSLPVVLMLCLLDGILAVTAKALTRGASATWLLHHERLRGGNAILNLGAMIGSALGPVLAGTTVASMGAAASLSVDAGSFLVTAAIIATARDLRLETDTATGFSTRLRTSWNAVHAYPAIRRLLVAIALVMMLGAIVIPIEVIFAKTTLHAGDRGYGLLLGAWGLGMMIGGAGFAAATEVSLIALLGVGTALAAIGYMGLALSPTLLTACAFSCLGGIGNGTGWIAAVTAVQERIPITTESAVMSILEGINQIMPGVGFVIGGAVTAMSSPRAAYGFSAVGILVVLVLVALHPIDRVRLRLVTDADTGASPPRLPLGYSSTRRYSRSDRTSAELSPHMQDLLPVDRTLAVIDG